MPDLWYTIGKPNTRAYVRLATLVGACGALDEVGGHMRHPECSDIRITGLHYREPTDIIRLLEVFHPQEVVIPDGENSYR